MKRTGKEISNMIRALRADISVTKKDKRDCYLRIIKTIFGLLWCNISAPFIYPIWYFNRVTIFDKLYKVNAFSTYEEKWRFIANLVSQNKIDEVKGYLKQHGYFLYFLWTYGDIDDPCGWGGMPAEYGKNNFWNRFRWSAIRNPRFNYNYIELRTSLITEAVTVIDTRNESIRHESFGIGSQADGVLFKWMKDVNGRWYFIYQEANDKALWWFGWVGLVRNGDIGRTGGRFELSYRVSERTYINN